MKSAAQKMRKIQSHTEPKTKNNSNPPQQKLQNKTQQQNKIMMTFLLKPGCNELDVNTRLKVSNFLF